MNLGIPAAIKRSNKLLENPVFYALSLITVAGSYI